ncbi:class I SAM-dependent methyltransferase [Paenibacillus sp. CAU 1782]
MAIIFSCLECKHPIPLFHGQNSCPKCGQILHKKGEIHLHSKSNHYYSDLDEDTMKSLIENCSKHGWRKTITDFFKSKPFLLRIIADDARADWQYLMPLNKSSIALDIGAGWGTITMPLARNVGHVVALDGTLDRLEFLLERAKQEKINNLTVVHADIFDNPLQGNQFDLVSFNGVLEWLGVGGEGDPKDIQLKALKIAYDLLKPGGFLYVGIENATGFKYVIGEPDDHTNIKFISYLDRESANKLSLSQNGTEYRTYTYSKAGYHNLLSETGFKNIEFLYPYPDYKIIESIHNVDERNVSKFLWNSMQFKAPSDSLEGRVIDLEKVMIEHGDLSPFISSFSILARKEERKAE